MLAQALIVVLLPLPVRFVLDTLLPLGGQQAEYLFNFNFFSLEMSLQGWLIVGTLTLIILALTNSGLELIEEWLTSRALNRLLNSVRADLMQKLITRKLNFVDSKNRIELLNNVSGDVQNLEIFVTAGLQTVARSLPTLFFILISMLLINWRFSLLLAIFLPLIYILTSYFSKQLRMYAKKHRSALNQYDSLVLQTIQSLALIKSLTSEQITLKQLKTRLESLSHSFEHMRKKTGFLNASLSGSKNLIRAFILLLGGLAILAKHITVGDLFVFMSYLEAINKPLLEIALFTAKTAKALVSIEKVETLNFEMSKNSEVSGTQHIESSEILKAEHPIVFDEVSFTYETSQHKIFDQLNLELTRNSLLAIVGPSGAGKSTFVKLLNGLHNPTSGMLLLAGQDMRNYSLTALRKRICVITQDPFLLAASVRDNLTLSSDEPISEDEIWQALQKVNADEFIRALPQGLDTLIGEAGQQLSGGQAKRLSLARAFLRKESAIFVFDEPTSGLDPASGQIVMQSIVEMAQKNALVIWATHRLSEVSLADKILFFMHKSNPILETHEELQKMSPLYNKLLATDRQEN